MGRIVQDRAPWRRRCLNSSWPPPWAPAKAKKKKEHNLDSCMWHRRSCSRTCRQRFVWVARYCSYPWQPSPRTGSSSHGFFVVRALPHRLGLGRGDWLGECGVGLAGVVVRATGAAGWVGGGPGWTGGARGAVGRYEEGSVQIPGADLSARSVRRRILCGWDAAVSRKIGKWKLVKNHMSRYNYATRWKVEAAISFMFPGVP
jgi:hypothetical protein